jgi:hypothetical protein
VGLAPAAGRSAGQPLPTAPNPPPFASRTPWQKKFFFFNQERFSIRCSDLWSEINTKSASWFIHGSEIRILPFHQKMVKSGRKFPKWALNRI